MLANIAPMARRSAAVTAVVAAVMVALSAALGGSKGLLGAAIAVVVVAAFFGLTVLALGRAAKVSPQAMMLAGIGTYLFKILVLLFLVRTLPGQHGLQPVAVRADGNRLGPGLRHRAGGVVDEDEDAVRRAGRRTMTRAWDSDSGRQPAARGEYCPRPAAAEPAA